MADAKIINYGQQISAGSTAIPDNTSDALDIESAGPDAKDYITIDTTDGSETLTLKAGGSSTQAVVIDANGNMGGNSGSQYKVWARGATATQPTITPYANRTTTGLGSSGAGQLSLIAGAQEGIRLTESGDAITAINVNGATVIQNASSGEKQLELKNDEGNVRWYWNDINFYGQAGSGSGRFKLTTNSATGSYLRYGNLHLGDELSDVTTALFHPVVGADVNTDYPVIKVEQLNTTDNPYAIEINNTGSGDSIHDTVSGAKLTSGGTWTAGSDIMHKEDIVDIPYGLAEVLQMQPRKYKLKKTGEEDIGFISQEMELIIPEVVHGDDAVMQDKVVDVAARPAELDENGEVIDPAREEKARFNAPTAGKSLSYSQLTAVLAKAIQELTARIEQLEGSD